MALLTVAGINYYIDPLWCFKGVNKYNIFTCDIDARQQKTNKITYNTNGYDTLIIGSSRTEHINQQDFTGYKAFNYAVPSIYPEEYGKYIDYFKKHNPNLKYVIIGLDFYGSNKKGVDRSKTPDYYLGKSNEPLYRLKILLSLDTFRLAVKTAKRKFKFFYYDRTNNNKCVAPIDGPTHTMLMQQQADRFAFIYDSKNYEYDTELSHTFEELIGNNPGIKFIVFTTPISQSAYELMLKAGRLDDYARWLRTAVSAFGGVCNFMYINSITADTSNYIDMHHFYPRIGTLIARRITGRGAESLPADFGVYVTRDNVDERLRMVYAQADEYLRSGGVRNRRK